MALSAKATTHKENVVEISQLRVVSLEMIAEAAYQKWVQRGRQHGYELVDWIQTERELTERAS